MRRIILTMLLSLALSLSAMAQYQVYSATSGVKIKTGSTQTEAKPGVKLSGADHVLVPKGGKIEILGTANKKIYASTDWGDLSVFNIIVDANKSASDHASTVGSRLDFGKSKPKNNATVFKEKGVVTRSQALFDPDAVGIEMDAAMLGRFIASKIAAGDTVKCASFPIRFQHIKNSPDFGLAFRIVNTLEYPVYFNIIKVDGEKGECVEISRLGQPGAPYVLQPSQAITREHFPQVGATEKHILVMAPCQYDVDCVIESMKKVLSGAEPRLSADEEMPVFASEL